MVAGEPAGPRPRCATGSTPVVGWRRRSRPGCSPTSSPRCRWRSRPRPRGWYAGQRRRTPTASRSPHACVPMPTADDAALATALGTTTAARRAGPRGAGRARRLVRDHVRDRTRDLGRRAARATLRAGLGGPGRADRTGAHPRGRRRGRPRPDRGRRGAHPPARRAVAAATADPAAVPGHAERPVLGVRGRAARAAPDRRGDPRPGPAGAGGVQLDLRQRLVHLPGAGRPRHRRDGPGAGRARHLRGARAGAGRRRRRLVDVRARRPGRASAPRRPVGDRRPAGRPGRRGGPLRPRRERQPRLGAGGASSPTTAGRPTTWSRSTRPPTPSSRTSPPTRSCSTG